MIRSQLIVLLSFSVVAMTAASTPCNAADQPAVDQPAAAQTARVAQSNPPQKPSEIVPARHMSVAGMQDAVADQTPGRPRVFHRVHHVKSHLAQSSDRIHQKTRESRDSVISWFCYIKGHGPAVWEWY